MGLDMGHRKGYAAEMAKRYRKASKQKKGQLIKEYVELTKCSRHYAAWLLRCWGTTVWTRHQGRPVKIVVGQRRARRRTPRVYDQEVVAALIPPRYAMSSRRTSLSCSALPRRPQVCHRHRSDSRRDIAR